MIRVKRHWKKIVERKSAAVRLCKKTIETLGAVAHELNNPCAIIGNAELLLLDITPDIQFMNN